MYNELFPINTNKAWFNAAIIQTAGMLCKHSRKATWAITQANGTVLEELREAKARHQSQDELDKLMVTENLNWPRMDLVFNLDSPSTKVCLIHDFMSRISSASATLSLEILSAE